MAEYMCDSNSEPNKYDGQANPEQAKRINDGAQILGPDEIKKVFANLERKVTENMSPEELAEYRRKEAREAWESQKNRVRFLNQIDWNSIYGLMRDAR